MNGMKPVRRWGATAALAAGMAAFAAAASAADDVKTLRVHSFNAPQSVETGYIFEPLAKDIDDPDSHLKLSKGTHTIEGEQALAFVRTRHSVGFGGDLSRIGLQQPHLA